MPYLAADFFSLRRGHVAGQRRDLDFTKTRAYRVYLYGLAIVPLPLLWLSVKQAQLAYAVFGSLFMPLLALTLLIMNNRRDWVGDRFRNGPVTNAVLVATLAFFGFVLFSKLASYL